MECQPRIFCVAHVAISQTCIHLTNVKPKERSLTSTEFWKCVPWFSLDESRNNYFHVTRQLRVMLNLPKRDKAEKHSYAMTYIEIYTNPVQKLTNQIACKLSFLLCRFHLNLVDFESQVCFHFRADGGFPATSPLAPQTHLAILTGWVAHRKTHKPLRSPRPKQETCL